MINIKIITVGKIKETYIKDAIDEYIKRLQGLVSFKIIEIGEEKAKTKLDSTEIQRIIGIENMKIKQNLSSNAINIALDIDGLMLSSLGFANLIKDTTLYQSSNITFIIGGSYGLTEIFKQECDYRISFSNMTFPHQLIRLFLIEQIYRAMMINQGHKYHK